MEQIFVMISIAAEEAGMHPQTLRMYEARGLIQPKRSTGNTRLYSEEDIKRLRLIQKLSAEGISLNGIERILDLEEALSFLKADYVQQSKLIKSLRHTNAVLRHQLQDAHDQLDGLNGGRKGF